jgi:hypothetical protein
VNDLWLGPDGDQSDEAKAREYRDKDFPARTSKKIMPRVPYGKLLGAIMPDDVHPPDSSSTSGSH